MLNATPLFRRALATAHNPTFRVELWRSGQAVDPNTGLPASPFGGTYFPFVSGSVSATLASRVTRKLSLTLPESRYPWGDTDPFNPYGDELRVWRGLALGDGTVEEFPVFVGRISSMRAPADGTFVLQADDLAAEVATAGFPVPQAGQTGTKIITEFRRLVGDAFPAARFGDSDDLWELVPLLTYDLDRGRALDDLATAAGSFWYTLADGSFVIRRVPWLQSAGPVMTMGDGEQGTVTKFMPVRDRAGVANSWTLVAERADGSAPLAVTEVDGDPASPLFVGGPFGVKSRSIQIQGALNLGQLRALARGYVARSRVLTQSATAECAVDPSIELGDPILFRVTVGGVAHNQVRVVAGLTVPLNAVDRMTLDLRAQAPLVAA